jgi:hypothetical protein
MAPPSDSAFAIHKVKGNRKTKLKEEKKKQKWTEMFSVWGNKLSQRLLKPSDDAEQIKKLFPTKAAENVMRLPELLGQVLKYVDSENLLTNKQLVNCTWMNTIKRTPALQKKLWQQLHNSTVSQPYGTTDWNGRRWHGSYGVEQNTLASGIPAYHGTFAVNMLATPTSQMRKTLADQHAKLLAADPPPPPPPRCPIPAFRGLISNNLDNLQRLFSPGPVGQITKRPTLVKPDELQTSIEPTPRGPLVTIGFQILRSLCRGYELDDDKRKVPAPQPAWLKMFVTDPPVAVVWIDVPIWMVKRRWMGVRVEHVQCSPRLAGGVTFADVRDAVGKMTLPDERPMADVSDMPYCVRLCFVADGLTVDGEEVRQVTKWVPTV